MLKKIFILLFISTLVYAFDWQSALKIARTKGVKFGIHWLSGLTYSENQNELKTPASLQKIFTAITAYKTFGASYKFETKISWNLIDSQNITDLTVHLSGDPSWGDPELGEDEFTRVRLIAQKLKEKGVLQIHGDIKMILPDPRWSTISYAQGVIDRHKTQCFGSRPQAVTLQRNCAGFVVSGVGQGQWFENGIEDKVELQIVLGAQTNITVSMNANETGFIVSGTWAQNAKKRLLILPVLKPVNWLKNLLIIALKEQGISFSESSQTGMGTISEISVFSPTLHEIIRVTLKNSVNILAESLFFNSAFKRYPDVGIRPHEAGVRAITDAFNELNIPVDPIYFIAFDGSGLSYDNKVTPSYLYAVLDKVKASDLMTYIWDALPIAAVDGTLKERMKTTAAAGVLRAKTGTLDMAKNLAGFIPETTDKGMITAFHPFVVIANFTANRGLVGVAETAGDTAGAGMVEELKVNQ